PGTIPEKRKNEVEQDGEGDQPQDAISCDEGAMPNAGDYSRRANSEVPHQERRIHSAQQRKKSTHWPLEPRPGREVPSRTVPSRYLSVMESAVTLTQVPKACQENSRHFFLGISCPPQKRRRWSPRYVVIATSE